MTDSGSGLRQRCSGSSVESMKILRTAAIAGLAKKAYDEARKPENQAKIRKATDKVKAEVKKRRH